MNDEREAEWEANRQQWLEARRVKQEQEAVEAAAIKARDDAAHAAYLLTPKGQAWAAKQAAEDAEAAAERERDEWHQQCRRIGVPVRFENARFEDACPGPAIAATDAWLEQEYRALYAGTCLVLSGPTGVGKTYAAICALRGFGEYRKECRFWYFPALCAALLDNDRRPVALEAAKEAPFAVFDDFGTEYLKPGGMIEAFADEIIWHREANERSTILTTNLTGDQLKSRLSDRIVDRLRGGWGHVVAITGSSLRVELR